MKKKLITILILILAIVALIFIVRGVTNTGKSILSKADLQNINTEMLLIQAKEKIIAEQSIVEDNKDILIGEKIFEVEYPAIEELKEKGVISEQEEHYSAYYVWDQSILNDLQLQIKLEEGQFYVVNYETNEIISTKGYKVLDKEETCYKLSESKNVTIEEP